jgi:hypothetical protein
VLAAPYSDKSLMRNVLAQRTARAIGRYAPRTRFVKLVLNGDYHGVYVLTQRIELGKGRVDVDEDGVHGGYILELTTRNQARGERRLLSPVTASAVPLHRGRRGAARASGAPARVNPRSRYRRSAQVRSDSISPRSRLLGP